METRWQRPSTKESRRVMAQRDTPQLSMMVRNSCADGYETGQNNYRYLCPNGGNINSEDEAKEATNDRTERS